MTDNIPQLIIDTDPGADDAAAILMACGLEKLGKIRLAALTCVAGNVPLALTQKNARIICDWAGREDLPVYAGADRPLLKTLFTAENVHGDNGLEGAPLHEPRTPLQKVHAALFLAQTLSNAPEGSVTLCPVGPLTNLALAFRLCPDCLRGVKEIVIMGGAFFEPGNVTPRADFNFFVDPAAAQIVLHCGVKIRVVPLDVTHKALLTPERMARLDGMSNQNGPRLANILRRYGRFDTENFALKGAPLHDPCAVARALCPEMFRQKEVYVDVITDGSRCEGASMLDLWHKSGKNPNVSWCYAIDDAAFFELFGEALAALP